MANKLYREEDIRAVAEAIRAKNKSSETYALSEMADAILAIETKAVAPLIVHSLVEDSGTFAKENFKSITIMTESVGEKAFYECAGLESVELVDVKSVGGWAFHNCSSLTSITIPASVTSIGDRVFGGDGALTSAHISDIAAWCGISFDSPWSNPMWAGADIYLNGERVTTLVIPNTVTSIGDYAFCGGSFTSVTFPDSVTSIGYNAFHECTSLTSVTIGSGVTSIGYGAFSYCSSLTSVTIPISVESIGRCAFDACDALTEFNYEGTVAEWTALDTQGIINREGVTVHCTDGDTVASYGSDD